LRSWPTISPTASCYPIWSALRLAEAWAWEVESRTPLWKPRASAATKELRSTNLHETLRTVFCVVWFRVDSCDFVDRPPVKRCSNNKNLSVCYTERLSNLCATQIFWMLHRRGLTLHNLGMTKLPSILGLILLYSTMAFAATATMRFDYYHTGDASHEVFSVDKVSIEPLPWPGDPSQAFDTRKVGK
jgi:hypothetical protein